MTRRKFLQTAGIGSATIALPAFTQFSCQKSVSQRPNIVILFTDDQRFNTINALNCPEIQTPNMDRLVKRGVSFTRAHIMGGTSGAVCMPSRSMLMTSKTLFHLKANGGIIPEDHVMFPEILRKNGYETIGIGKWHNGKSSYARCFTGGGKIFFGGMSNHAKVPVHDFDPAGLYDEKEKYIGKKFSSELFTDEALKFLNSRKDGKPFLLYLSYTAPHDPRMAPKKYADMYPPEKVSVPENFLPIHPFDNGELDIRDENLAPKPRTPEIVKEHLGAYYAMITHLDDQIGRVLDNLEQSGEIDNTIIFFAGDNGLAVGCHGLMGKQNLYEHSVRVPLIISGPGIGEGEKTDTLCYLNDIFPTICDMIDEPVPETVEGKSLVPALEDLSLKIRPDLFLAYTHLQRGIRTDNNWKYIEYNLHGKQTQQLFNLNADPIEMVNLAGTPEHSGPQRELAEKLHAYMKRLGDFCDPDKPNWGLPPEVLEKKPVSHKAVNKSIHYVNPPSPKYPADGEKTLINGYRGTSTFFDGNWLGWQKDDMEAVIDLGTVQPVSSVTAGFLQNHPAWIFPPVEVKLSLSADGKTFSSVKTVEYTNTEYSRFKFIRDISGKYNNEKARYIKVIAKNMGINPKWHHAPGGKSWMFADEIIVK